MLKTIINFSLLHATHSNIIKFCLSKFHKDFLIRLFLCFTATILHVLNFTEAHHPSLLSRTTVTVSLLDSPLSNITPMLQDCNISGLRITTKYYVYFKIYKPTDLR